MTKETKDTEPANHEANIEIVEYSEELAAVLAEMYNGWDELWIGGFTQGVPFTEARVKEQFGKMSAIAILIALDADSHRPVGSCTLHAHVRDADAAYVGTLGVSPEVLNQRVGKRLLLRAIEISKQDGRTRVDLNTWAGNMRAVPLYKKVGMMWNPTGDGVQMEDYIPGILSHPLTQRFFKSLPEGMTWYDVQKREIVQAPDEFTQDNMEIFPYRFEYGQNYLSVTIDKHSRYITSVESMVDGSRLKVRARVPKHTTLCGVPSEYILDVENDSGADLHLTGELKAFSHMKFIDKPSTSMTVSAGSSSSWKVGFTVASDAPIHRRNLRTPAVNADLKLGDDVFRLSTGLMIKPAAEVRVKSGECRIAPGGKAEIALSIISSADFSLNGILHVDSPTPKLKVAPTEANVTMDKEGLSGAILEVSAQPDLDAETYDLWAYMDLTTPERLSFTTRRFRVPVFCLESGSIGIGEDDRLRRKVILTSEYTATYDYEGAMLRATSAGSSGEGTYLLRSQVGPPFGIDSFRFAPRDVQVSDEGGDKIVVMSGAHPEKPLLIEDIARFEKGTSIIEYQLWTTNTGSEPQTVQVRIFGGGQGVNISAGTKYIPLKGGVVSANANSLLTIYPSFPSNPKAFQEGWIALEGRASAKGEIWDHNAVEEIRIGNNQIISLHYPTTVIQPGERLLMSRVWLMMAAPGWRDVRRTWLARVEKHFPMESEAESLVPHPILDVRARPAILASVRKTAIEVEARKAIVTPIPVDLEVTPPAGWAAELVAPEDCGGEEADTTGRVGYLMNDHDKFLIDLVPSNDVADGFAVHTGFLNMKMASNMSFPIHIIQLGKRGSEVKIQEIEDQGVGGYSVDNGVFRFKASHNYGSCLYSLTNFLGTELLVSTFPTAEQKPGGFFNNYFGGIQPVIWDESHDELFMNALTNREDMTGAVIEEGLWKGVEFTWIGKNQISTRGATLKVQYLTAAGSPLLIVRWIIENSSGSPLTLIPTLFVDAAFDTVIPDMLFTAEVDGAVADFYQSPVASIAMPNNNIIWMHRSSETGDNEGLALVGSGPNSGVLGISFGSSLTLGTMNFGKLIMPGDCMTSTACFVVDPDSFDILRALQENVEFLVEH